MFMWHAVYFRIANVCHFLVIFSATLAVDATVGQVVPAEPRTL